MSREKYIKSDFGDEKYLYLRDLIFALVTSSSTSLTDNRRARLYLTRTLDVKLERCTIYVILDGSNTDASLYDRA